MGLHKFLIENGLIRNKFDLKTLPERSEEFERMETMLELAESYWNADNDQKAKNILRQLVVFIHSFVNS